MNTEQLVDNWPVFASMLAAVLAMGWGVDRLAKWAGGSRSKRRRAKTISASIAGLRSVWQQEGGKDGDVFASRKLSYWIERDRKNKEGWTITVEEK